MTTYYIRSGGNDANAGTSTGAAWLTFQYGLNHITHGDILDVEAGMTFSNGGTAFSVPFVAGGTDTIADLKTVRSSAYASLTDGVRVGPSDAANMFKLVATAANPAIQTATPVPDFPKWWKFIGMEVTNSGTGFNNGLAIFGGPCGPGTPPSAYGDEFTFDRCYFHPQEHVSTNYKRTCQLGFWWNAGHITFINSYTDGFWGIYGHAAAYHPITVDTATDIITFTDITVGFWFTTNTIIVSSTGTLPSPLTTDPTYYYPVGQRAVTDAVTNSTTTVTSATATFTSGDTGKQAQITDGTNFSTGTITFVNSTTITIAPSGAGISWSSSGNRLSIFESSSTLKLSTTLGGAPVNLTTSGSGTLSAIIPEAINSGGFWSNMGGPYDIDNNQIGANYNPMFIGAGATGSSNEGTIASGATDAGMTLSNTTNIDVGDLLAVEVNVPVWSPSIFLYAPATAIASTNKITMDSPYNGAHGLLDGDTIYIENSTAGGISGFPTRYYVVNKSTSDFEISLIRGGTAVNITSDGSMIITIGGHGWATAKVLTVNHGTGAITFEYYARFEGYSQTPQLAPPFDYVQCTAYPKVGGVAKWDGYIVEDWTLTHNTINIDRDSAVYNQERTGAHPKAYSEIKQLKTALWEGNIFQGYPSVPMAFVLASQNGTTPWVTVRDITFRNNFVKNCSVLAFLQISTAPPAKDGGNIVIENNLVIGNATSGLENGPGWIFSGVGGGEGLPLTCRHNTFHNEGDIAGGYMFTSGGIAFPFIAGPDGAIIKDNIMWWNSNGVQLGLNETYWPNHVEDQNLIVDTWGRGFTEIITNNFPNSLYAADTSDVDFVGGGTGTTTADWALLATSPGYHTASEGGTKNIGVDIAILDAALAGGTGNSPPIVNAGVDQTLSGGTTVTTLTATADDPDLDAMTYLWTRISGPNTPTIVSDTSLSTSVTGLIQGVYVFRFTATDTFPASTSDDVQVTVSANVATHAKKLIPISM